MVPRKRPWNAAYAITSPGRTFLLNVLTMLSAKPPMRPSISAPPPRFAFHANEPTTRRTAKRAAVLTTTSSMVMRPVCTEDADGAEYDSSSVSVEKPCESIRAKPLPENDRDRTGLELFT